MPFTARCWTRPQTALAIATLLLSGCATGVSDTPPGVCSPVVDYSRAEQTRVVEEVAALAEGTLIIELLADYAMLRDQVRACQ